MTGKVIPLQQTYPEQRPDQVTTFDRLSSYNIGKRINPDDLVGVRGLGIYLKMCADEQVKAVLNFKRDAITARGWQFCFPKTTSLSEDEQEARVRLFDTIVAKMRGSFSDALNAIMTGRAFGFSIVEKVYGTVELDGKEWPGINMLLGRDPKSFYFYTDDYGVVNKIEQQTPRSGLVEVDRQRIIHYVHAPEWDHVFGRSDLREAYRSWYIKEQTLRLWPTYLERFAGGFVHAELDSQTSLSQQELDSLDEALANAKSIGAIRTPPGVKLNVVQPPGNAEVYKSAIEFHDLAIAKALLVPNLLGISHTGQTGAFAQSQTQLTAFYWTLNADASRLEECLNEQLFRDLGDQAWGDGEYPRFQFKPASMDHVKWVVETWLAMLDKGAALATLADEAFLRKLLDLPPREEEDKTIAEDQQERAPAPPPMAPGAAPPGGEQTKQPAAEQDDGEEEDAPPKKEKMAREDFEWDESQHPRDKDGKFGDGAGGPDSSGMSAGQINKELDKLDKEDTRINDELIAAGRGSERPSDMRGKTDPLSKRFWDNVNRRAALRDEITARYGPSAPSRLPKGFGPRARLSRSEPTTVTTKRRHFYIAFKDEAQRTEFARWMNTGVQFEVGQASALTLTDDAAAPDAPNLRFSFDTEHHVIPAGTKFVVVGKTEGGYEVVLAP